MLLLTPSQVNSAELIFVMGIVLDRMRRKVLLQIPNALGWKLHFGCMVEKQDSLSSYSSTLVQQLAQALACENDRLPEPSHVGRMRFEFENCQHPSMLVHVYTVLMDTQTLPSGGQWYDFDAIPYPQMWADDPLWMPQLLRDICDQHDPYYFEGHFVFDGPPGAGTPLLRHQVATTPREL